MSKRMSILLRILISLFDECNLKYKSMVVILAFNYYTVLCYLVFGEPFDTIRSINISIILTFVFLCIIVKDMLKRQ